MKDKNAILEFNRLVFSYPGYPPVIDGFSASLFKGEIVCVIGPSGCGKTTLLNIAAGFLTANSGSVTDRGIKIEHPEMKRIMVFQDSHQLFPWLTVRENILFPTKRFRKSGRRCLFNSKNLSGKKMPDADKLIKLVGLEKVGDLYPRQLSGGMKQRTVIARAISVEPEMLLLDEPFTALDAPTRRSLQHLLIRLNLELEISMLFVTHDITEALYIADRLIIINGGKTEVIDVGIDRVGEKRDVYSDVFVDMERKVYRMISQ